MHIIIGVRGHHCYTQGCGSQSRGCLSCLRVKARRCSISVCLVAVASVCLPSKLHDLPAGTNPDGKSRAQGMITVYSVHHLIPRAPSGSGTSRKPRRPVSVAAPMSTIAANSIRILAGSRDKDRGQSPQALARSGALQLAGAGRVGTSGCHALRCDKDTAALPVSPVAHPLHPLEFHDGYWPVHHRP